MLAPRIPLRPSAPTTPALRILPHTAPSGVVWYSQRRELRVGGELVKKFRQPADVQETILTAFAEQGWPPRIDDPLPPIPGRDQKQRLRETISKLNRGHRCRRIRFYSDGRGQGICYELIAPPSQK